MNQEQALKLTKSLCKDLADDRVKLRTLDRYYTGDHPLSFASDKFLEAFGGLFKASAVNWCPLVIASVVERLRVEGFRTGRGSNKRAWKIWQANNLDADSNIAHREAGKYGRTYAMIGAPDVEGEPPLITIESPLDVIHRQSSENRRRRAAALRVFTADDGTYCATLYTPDEIWRWQRQGSGVVDDLAMVAWEPRYVEDRPFPEVNELGVVPIVPLLATPELDGWGTSDLASVLPLQDMVNKTVADMLVASEFVAMPQRYVAGLDIVRDPKTEQPLPPFPITSRLWQSENPEAKFGQFPSANLSTYVETLETLKQDIATITRTPPHYFYLGGQFPSGSAIKSAETGLVAKARDRMLTFGEGWEEVMRLALAIDGRSPQTLTDMETVWGDPEYHDEAATADSLIKRQAIGVPWEQLMVDAGYSPQQIESWQALHDAQVAAAAAANLPNGDAPASPGGIAARTDQMYAPPQQ